MIDFLKIKAISLDLDDTLWPVWPTIARAEETLAQWLAAQAPQTAPLCAIPGYQRKIREEMAGLRPDLVNDLSALRREAIRVLLQRAGENPDLAEPAFEVFFEARQKVVFFEDALPSLQFLQSKFPMVALSNGNADVHKVGIGHYFVAAFNPLNLGQQARSRHVLCRRQSLGRFARRGASHWRRSPPRCSGFQKCRDASRVGQPRRKRLGARNASRTLQCDIIAGLVRCLATHSLMHSNDVIQSVYHIGSCP